MKLAFSRVVLGVTLDTLATQSVDHVEYPVHDRRTGKPTGQFDTEYKHTIKPNDGSLDDIVLHESTPLPTIYAETLWNFDEATEFGEIGAVFLKNNGFTHSIQNIVIGRVISSISKDDFSIIEAKSIIDEEHVIRDFLMQKFCYDGDVKMFHVQSIYY